MRYQVIQECTRIFHECLEGKHSVIINPNDCYQIGTTKVKFHHPSYSRYFGVYYGIDAPGSRTTVCVHDSVVEYLAGKVFEKVSADSRAQQRAKECKLMEELLRS